MAKPRLCRFALFCHLRSPRRRLNYFKFHVPAWLTQLPIKSLPDVEAGFCLFTCTSTSSRGPIKIKCFDRSGPNSPASLVDTCCESLPEPRIVRLPVSGPNCGLNFKEPG